MKIVFFTLLVVAFPLLAADTAMACSCLPPAPVAEEVKRSIAVFSGRVIEIKHHAEPDDLFRSVEVVFAVSRIWKGVETKTLSVFTSPDSASCGYNFKLNETYLVYAAGDREEELQATICSRTARIKAAKDLKHLGPGKVIGRRHTR